MKLTVKALLDLKGRRQLTEVLVTTPGEARACEAAGIDMVIASERVDVRAIRAAAPDTFFTIGLRYGSQPSAEAAVRGGFEAMSAGADAVYAGVGLRSVEAMADEGIPVVGHVGYIPYKSTWFGGARAVGKTAPEALEVLRRTVAYQDAGAVGVEMEIVPHRIAAEISRRVRLVVLSMGSGTGCDGQYLFASDILGITEGHVPRHAKVYGDLAASYERLQQETVAALCEFKDEVEGGGYPAPEHLVEVDDGEYAAFVNAIDARSRRT